MNLYPGTIQKIQRKEEDLPYFCILKTDELIKNWQMDNIEKYDNFLFYQSEGGTTKIRVIIDDDKETIWVTQNSMAEIFDTSKQNISYHLINIFKEEELIENRVVKEILTTASDNKNYKTKFYNLDVIISVGYRINSYKATKFRIWATHILKEYMIKGFALDDERLKQGTALFGKDYFDELLERIREIRASERRFYQKITDIYAQCSIDYDPQSPITQEFYATVQNKLHWAIHHHTAAELIAERADAKKPHMGLNTWKNAKKKGKILKSDVTIAKNYLNEKELSELNRVVSMYLDFAENMAKRKKALKMVDWVKRLEAFLQFNEYNILKDAGRISAKVARKMANNEFEKFRVIQDKSYRSDFDKVAEKMKSEGKLPKQNYLMPKSESLSNFNKNLKKALDSPPPKEDKK